MAEQVLKTILLTSIRENPSALRPVAEQHSEKFLGLVDSIKNFGVLSPILVRQLPSQDGEELYGIINGLQRFSAAQQAGLTDIPVKVMNMDDGEAMMAQMICNLHVLDTKPVQYSEQLKRLLAGNPTWTKGSLAQKLAKTTTWLDDRLRLLNLDKRIGALVDEGKINLSNGHQLAKLPPEEQEYWIDRAMTMAPDIFTQTVLARKKELDTAKRQGRDPNKVGFQAVAHVQTLSTLRQEFEKPTIGPVLRKENGPTSPDPATQKVMNDCYDMGFSMGIRYALNLDPRSVDAAKARDDQRKQVEQEKRLAAAAERAHTRAEEAARAAAAVQLQEA